tara:strand:+ start:4326 stop:5210 length:885 start_codon:yes stop_codon:yes gene_type:complete
MVRRRSIKPHWLYNSIFLKTKEYTHKHTKEQVMIKELKMNRKQKSLTEGDDVIMVPVFKTDNYDKFLLIESNRLIKPGKISRMKEVIERKDLTNENEIKVLVSENGKTLIVIEGQHRFITCMELGLPIYYRFSDMEIDDIGMVNSVQDKWSLYDSLHHYCERGIQDYSILHGFKKQYQYPISTLINVLAGRNDKSMLEEFRRGEFKITQGLEIVHDLLGKIQEFKQFNDRIYRHRTFLRVYMDLMTHPEFEHDRMMQKVEQVPMKFVYCTKVNDYLRMIEDVYNWNNRNPIKLY